MPKAMQVHGPRQKHSCGVACCPLRATKTRSEPSSKLPPVIRPVAKRSILASLASLERKGRLPPFITTSTNREQKRHLVTAYVRQQNCVKLFGSFGALVCLLFKPNAVIATGKLPRGYLSDWPANQSNQEQELRNETTFQNPSVQIDYPRHCVPGTCSV